MTVDLPPSKLARRELEDAHDPQHVTHARPLWRVNLLVEICDQG